MELWPSDKHRLAYMTSLLLFQYCLPLVLVLLCYVRIFLRLKRRRSHSRPFIFPKSIAWQSFLTMQRSTGSLFVVS